jgi:hypothetical protein
MKHLSILLMLISFTGASSLATVHAADPEFRNPATRTQTAETRSTKECNPSNDQLVDPDCPLAVNLTHIYNNSIGILLWLVILMFIVAGYIYITSMGSQERVKLAKDILVTTLTGAVLLIMLPLILKALGQEIAP